MAWPTDNKIRVVPTRTSKMEQFEIEEEEENGKNKRMILFGGEIAQVKQPAV